MNLPNFPNLPFQGLFAGLRTQFGMWTPPGANIIYVRSTGVQSGDDAGVAQRLLPTLAAGLAQCRTGMGDIVCVLPGHTENVTDATMLTNLVAGTRIIGVGDLNRDDAPTFTWTATASQWAITVKNVEISGLRLLMDGANGVVKAINITAAGCILRGNFMRWASGAALKATIAIEVGSGATDCMIEGNDITGTATHNVTDGIKVVGATVPNRLKILGNTIIASATAANGLIHVTVAALNMEIRGNRLYNTHTASTACIAVDDVAADGLITDNYCSVKNNGTVTSQGLTFGTSALTQCFNNQACDEPKKSGLLTPTAAT